MRLLTKSIISVEEGNVEIYLERVAEEERELDELRRLALEEQKAGRAEKAEQKISISFQEYEKITRAIAYFL